MLMAEITDYPEVSTHSRLKAAGTHKITFLYCSSFNTQPPKGGWGFWVSLAFPKRCFNTQPPKGGWGWGMRMTNNWDGFNTQPPKGGWA